MKENTSMPGAGPDFLIYTILIIAVSILSYRIYTDHRNSPNVGDVYIRATSADNPFEIHDTITILAVSNGYVQYRNDRSDFTNSASSSTISSVYKKLKPEKTL